MARKVIRLGRSSDRYDGDTYDSALSKCNDNFSELYSRISVDATDYGVVGDGSTDNQDAIEKLINWRAPAGAVVKFPYSAEPYLISSPVSVLRSDVVIVLDPGVVVKAKSDYSADAFSGMFTLGSTTTAVSNVRIYGPGCIDGNSIANFAISSRGNHFNIDVDGVLFKNTVSAALDLRGNQNTLDDSVKSCTADATTNVFTSASHGFNDGDKIILFSAKGPPQPIQNGEFLYVRDADTNTFKVAYSSGGTAVDLITAGGANLYAQQFDYDARDFSVRNCRVEDCGEGLKAQGVFGLQFLNNYITRLTSQDGIETENCMRVQIIGNTINGPANANSGLEFYNTLIDAVIANNNVFDETSTVATTKGVTFAGGAADQSIKHNVLFINNNISGRFNFALSTANSQFSAFKMIGNTFNCYNVQDDAGQGTIIQKWGPGCISVGNTYYGELYGLWISAASFAFHSIGDSFLGRRDRGLYVQFSATDGVHRFVEPQFIDDDVAVADSGQQYYVRAQSAAIEFEVIGAKIPSSNNVTRVSAWTSTTSTQKFINCQNYKTRNGGVATLANGTTSIAVTHGLGDQVGSTKQNITPNKVFITPVESLGTAAKFWVSGITSTQFTINVDADPGADVDFAWEAVSVLAE